MCSDVREGENSCCRGHGPDSPEIVVQMSGRLTIWGRTRRRGLELSFGVPDSPGLPGNRSSDVRELHTFVFLVADQGIMTEISAKITDFECFSELGLGNCPPTLRGQ